MLKAWIFLGEHPHFFLFRIPWMPQQQPHLQVIFGAAAVVGKLGVERFNPLLFALIHGFADGSIGIYKIGWEYQFRDIIYDYITVDS